MGLLLWLPFGLPTLTGIGDGLKRSGFIFCIHGQSQLFTGLVSLFDYVFFPSASGSVTMTFPRLRLRTTAPV